MGEDRSVYIGAERQVIRISSDGTRSVIRGAGGEGVVGTTEREGGGSPINCY